MLMNGKEVNHLVINGETFDKRYLGKEVEILNDIRGDSMINIHGDYFQPSGSDTWILPKGSKGFMTAIKFFDCYYLLKKSGEFAGVWAKPSDIKILD